MTAADYIAANETAVGTALDNAVAHWTSFDVRIGGLVSGTDPTQALGALRMIRDNSVKPWTDRGSQLDTTDQSALDAWVSDGQGLVKDINDVGGYATDVEVTTIVADTAKQTATDITNLPAKIPELLLDAPWYVWTIALVVACIIGYAIYRRFRG